MDDYYYDSNGNLDEGLQPLMIDIGHGMMKCGFSGDDAPRAVFPTIVGKYIRVGGVTYGMDFREYFVGDEAQAKRGILDLSRPIPSNRFDQMNFEYLMKIFHQSFYRELKITPEEHPLLISSLPIMKKGYLKKLSEMFFETFNVPGFQIIDKSVLSLFALGKETGNVLRVGDAMTCSTSIHEGIPIRYSRVVFEDKLVEESRKRICGSLLTDVLSNMLTKNGKFEATSSADLEIVRDMKEHYCAFSIDQDRCMKTFGYENEKPKMPYYYDSNMYMGSTRTNCEEINKIHDKDYQIKYILPDEKTIVEIGDERFKATEIFFRPSIIGYSLPGIHEIVKLSIESCDLDIQKELYKNIILSGGSTMINNFKERLTIELQDITNSHIKVNAPPERKFSSWLGGSRISAPDYSFQKEWWVTSREYKEHGYSIVERKCRKITEFSDQNNRELRFLKLGSDIDLNERREYVIQKYAIFVEETDEKSLKNTYFCVCFGDHKMYFRCRSFLML